MFDSIHPVLRLATLLIAVTLLVAAPGAADDRELLRDSVGDPYVFIMFDTSGSMHWTPVCSAEDAADDIDPFDLTCTTECEYGALCEKLCPNWGCVEYDLTSTDPPVEVIVDNLDPGFATEGTWFTSSGVPGFYGTEYVWSRNIYPTSTATFTPSLPETREYEVYMYWSSNSVRADSIPVDIVHANGTDTVIINQRSGGAQWNLLGTYDFNAGTTGTVTIRTDTASATYVSADAVRFFAQDLPPCLREGYRCEAPLCESGDCFARLNSDDPTSKFFQAKEAMVEVLDSVDSVRFGFATYNQNNLRARSKHWLYRVPETEEDGDPTEQVTLDGGTLFPAYGSEEVFGRNENWSCTNGSTVACQSSSPADLSDEWELLRAQRYPKLGIENSVTTDVWIRENNSQIYRVRYSPSSDDYGDDRLEVDITVSRCDDNTDCAAGLTDVGSIEVEFELISSFLAWDVGAGRGPSRQGFFNQSSNDLEASSTCNGWDPNTDSGNDDYSNNNLKFTTTADTFGRGDDFGLGDVIPLDWKDGRNNIAEIQNRLAPSLVNGADPEYRPSMYFEDLPNDPTSTTRNLELLDDDERPLIAFGSTPLGASMSNFRTWYADWRAVAENEDLDFACRRKYILMITDGDETCGGTPCSVATTLRDAEDVRTFVVGFGLEAGNDNKLECMASNGGTGEPIYPKDKDELVDALTSIFQQIRSEASAFASASVPAVQSAASDKIFLTSFFPQESQSVWPGRIDAFRQPLPLTEAGEPDTDRNCASLELQSNCHLWDAGTEMLNQVPTPSQLAQDPPDLNLGSSLNDRRVFYPLDPELYPNESLQLLDYPEGNANAYLRNDLFEVFLTADELATLDPGTDEDSDERADKLKEVLRFIYESKEGNETDADGILIRTFDYILGDIFHADPLVTEGPRNLDFLRRDLCGRDTEPGEPPDNCPENLTDDDLEERGYAHYVDRNVWRRKMLVAAANDGQVHFFDGGYRIQTDDPSRPGTKVQVFNDGTGRELFSVMPRLAMPIVREQANFNDHVYSLDGSFAVADVVIDPVQPLDREQREWRNVIVAGMREAGDVLNSVRQVEGFVPGYYALDITFPDGIGSDPDDPTVSDLVPLPEEQDLPSCLSTLVTGISTSGLSGDACETLSGEDISFPAILWEFTDRVTVPDFTVGGVTIAAGGTFHLDEDDVDSDGTKEGNGQADLASTWSKPLIGQIVVIENGDETTKWVAMFGGGIDASRKALVDRGNYFYMVDIETGETIYKRQVVGSVAADITGIDENRDGIFDYIYIATTAGYLYKVDLTTAIELEEITIDPDLLLDYTYLSNPLVDGDVADALLTTRLIDAEWDPFVILDANDPNDPSVVRPFYFPPATVPIPELELFALAIGTGDREDLWEDGPEARFFVVVDENFEAGDFGLPRDEEDYESIAPGDSATQANPVVNPATGNSPGWVLELPDSHRVTARPFVLNGVMIFNSFEPRIEAISPDGETVCARSGQSFVYVIDARNADPLTQFDDTGTSSADCASSGRCKEVSGSASAPFVSPLGTKNAPDNISGDSGTDSGLTVEEFLQEDAMRQLYETMKNTFFPTGCRFNDAYMQVISMRTSNTANVAIAPAPLGHCPAEWFSENALIASPGFGTSP
ncbi:MAG: hypothetical protein AAGD38_06250 [Acidobacteriota bacterium]